MTHPIHGVGTGPASYAPPAVRPRRPRAVPAFYLAVSLLLTALVFAGFWPTYFGPIARGTPTPRPWVIHIHGAVFLGWMALFLTQVTLVFRRRTADHRALGRIGIGYGILVLVMGLVVSITAPLMRIGSGEWTLDQAASFIALPLGDMVLFGALFGASIAYRRRPEIHKRLMLLATVAIVFAAVARLTDAIGVGPLVGLPIWLAPVAIAMGHDLWTRRRIHGAYVAGTAFLLVGFSRVFVMETEAWRRVGRAILRAFTPV